MQEENYYTPSIEDIRVGYECQWLQDPTKDLWIPLEITLDRYKFVVQNGQDSINFGIRTPYLTKEQIEGEGWGSYDKGFSHNKEVDGEGYHIWYSEYSNFLSIEKGKSPFRKVLFLGKCPSINEFRFITKLLGI